MSGSAHATTRAAAGKIDKSKLDCNEYYFRGANGIKLCRNGDGSSGNGALFCESSDHLQCPPSAPALHQVPNAILGVLRNVIA